MTQGSSPLKAFLGTVLLTGTVLTSGVYLMRHMGWLEARELAAYDAFIHRRQPDKPDDRIVVVGISEEDIQQREEYPIHDGTVADLLTTLERFEPAVIGLDVGRDVLQGPPVGRKRLTEVIAKSDRILTTCLLSSANNPGVPAAPGTPPERIAAADLPEDPGGVIRRVSLVSTPGNFPTKIGKPHACNDTNPENEVPSLSFAVALAYLQMVKPDLQPGQTSEGYIQLESQVLSRLQASSGGYAKADTPDYQMLLNYRAKRDAVPVVSLGDVLDRNVDGSMFKDRIVLIGYTSQIANDMHLTPYPDTTEGSRRMPGVIVHAQAASQIISTVLDKRSLLATWPEPVDLAWVWGWSLLGGIIAFTCRPLWLFLVSEAGAIAACWGICLLLFSQGLWVPFVPSWMGLLLIAIAVRLLHGANQSGYTQAFYQNLLEQVRRQGQEDGGDRQDYLQRLARKAQAIREGKSEEDLILEKITANSKGSGVYQQARDKIKEDLLPQLYAEIERDVRAKIARESRMKQFETVLKQSQTLRKGDG